MLGRILRILVLVLVAMSGARADAQPCAQPVTNLATTSGLCAVRITWTPSANTLTQVVRWGIVPNYNFSTPIATLTAGVSTVDHTSPGPGTNYYWVVSNPVNFTCAAATAGPISGSTLTDAPAPTSIISACTSTTIVGRAVFDATTYKFYRRVAYSNDTFAYVSSSSAPVFTDASGLPGVIYAYGVVPFGGSCPDLTTLSYVNSTFGGIGAEPSMPAPVVAVDGATGTTVFDTQAVVPTGTSLQWMKNGQPLAESAHVQNVHTDTLTLTSPHQWSDAGAYKLRMTSTCGVTYSAQTYIVITPRTTCPADFNGSGTKDVQDIFDFLAAWFAPCP